MAMSILLRNSREKSLFRRALLELSECNGKGDTLVISSGFMNKTVLRDNSLIGAICLGFPNGGTVKILGGQFLNCSNCKKPECHYCNFNLFVKEIRNEMIKLNSSIFVESYFVPDYHAKVAFKLDNNNVIAGLVGSSNLSSRAFDEGKNVRYWNKECDIYILHDDLICNSQFVSNEARDEKEKYSSSINEFYQAFLENSYALDIIPVDSRIPDTDILTRLYDEVKFFLTDRNKFDLKGN